MTAPVYLGDEIAAAGFRLAGVDVSVPERDSESAALAAARETAPLVLISAAVAARIPESEMRVATAALAPLVLVVPDLTMATPLPDLAARLRRQLGLEA
jgi:vacuolar-type H+-ATPase subunit F/Vma7